jgi:hypothetical protein
MAYGHPEYLMSLVSLSGLSVEPEHFSRTQLKLRKETAAAGKSPPPPKWPKDWLHSFLSTAMNKIQISAGPKTKTEQVPPEDEDTIQLHRRCG